MQDYTATMRHGVTRKRSTKRLKHTGICLERTYSQKISVNSRLRATKIIGQRKALYGQRIPVPSCTRKETVDIQVCLTQSKNVRNV